MEINRQQRDRARKKTTMEYEAVDSTVSEQKPDPVHRHSENKNTVSRSGVVVRTPKNYGASSIQKARDMLDKLNNDTLKRPRTVRDAGRDWFKINQKSVERLVRSAIGIDKNQVLGKSIESKFRPSKERLEEIAECGADFLLSATDQDLSDFEEYRPVIDDDAEFYVPKSEQ